MLGHHSTAIYGIASPVTVAAVVNLFESTNPHAYIYLDIKSLDIKSD